MKTKERIQSDIEYYFPNNAFYKQALSIQQTFLESRLEEERIEVSQKLSILKSRAKSEETKFNKGSDETNKEVQRWKARLKTLDYILNI